MGVILFNGKSSRTYGIEVEHPPAYKIAERNYESVSVPGRNGDLYYSGNKSYKNVPREYDISFYNEQDNMEKIANRLYEFLHSANGYARLEDSYDTDVFRLAYYVKKLDLENILFKAGRGKIEFSCKPQRFLKTGEEGWIFYSDNFVIPRPYTPTEWDESLYDAPVHRIFDHDDWAQGTIRIPNTTYNDSYPLIRILTKAQLPGESAVVYIRNWSITYTLPDPCPDYLDIDCETMEVSCGGVSYNSCVVFNTTDNIIFPARSESRIVLQSDVEYAVRIIPRWWIL